jgi:hypothetical protein
MTKTNIEKAQKLFDFLQTRKYLQDVNTGINNPTGIEPLKIYWSNQLIKAQVSAQDIWKC